MTDIELLELAAKAAGIEIRGNANKWIAQGVTELDLLVWNDRGGDSVWNPLTDDGDALRLAVKSNIDVVFDFDRVMAVYGNGYSKEEYFYELPTSTDRFVATRRAIVRAAAELGKTSVEIGKVMV
jgi:hypothetical protein